MQSEEVYVVAVPAPTRRNCVPFQIKSCALVARGPVSAVQLVPLLDLAASLVVDIAQKIDPFHAIAFQKDADGIVLLVHVMASGELHPAVELYPAAVNNVPFHAIA